MNFEILIIIVLIFYKLASIGSPRVQAITTRK